MWELLSLRMDKSCICTEFWTPFCWCEASSYMELNRFTPLLSCYSLLYGLSFFWSRGPDLSNKASLFSLFISVLKPQIGSFRSKYVVYCYRKTEICFMEWLTHIFEGPSHGGQYHGYNEDDRYRNHQHASVVLPIFACLLYSCSDEFSFYHFVV